MKVEKKKKVWNVVNDMIRKEKDIYKESRINRGNKKMEV